MKQSVEEGKIVMALNLCAVSISRILDSQSVEVMENEYNTILNNLNLQKIEKHDALLDVLRKLLDVITFFRLQEGDRRRLEARNTQRMNNLLWNSVSQLRGMFVVSGDVCSVAAAAAIQGATMYFGYRNQKNEIKIDYADEAWKLERSALEQLHGLRTALFETAWKLSSEYDFDDSWRLTTKQIEWYNTMCANADPVVRCKQLEQYELDFGHYPYYWYERGVAAQEVVAELTAKKDELGCWLKKAMTCLKNFIDLDKTVNLLRQNVVGADARLRYGLLVRQQTGEGGWSKAVADETVGLGDIRKLAVEDTGLMFKTAMLYASAYEESLKLGADAHNAAAEGAAGDAISLLELLTYSGKCLPSSSIMLSRLYQMSSQKEKNAELELFGWHYGNGNIVVLRDEVPDEIKQQTLSAELENFRLRQCVPISDLFAKQFDVALRMSHGSIFNAVGPVRRQNLFAWVQTALSAGEEKYKQTLFDFWARIKDALNESFLFDVKSLCLPEDDVRHLAMELNQRAYKKISTMQSREALIKAEAIKKEDLVAALIEMQNLIQSLRAAYVRKLSLAAARRIGDGVAAEDIGLQLSMHLDSQIARYQLIGLTGGVDSNKDEVDYFDDPLCRTLKDGGSIEWKEYNGSKADFLFLNKMTFTIDFLAEKGSGTAIDEQHKRLIIRLLKNRYPDSVTSWRDETKQTIGSAVKEVGEAIKEGVNKEVDRYKAHGFFGGIGSMFKDAAGEIRDDPKKVLKEAGIGTLMAWHPWLTTAAWLGVKGAPTAYASTINFLKEVKSGVVGAMDFVITEWPDRIEVVYTKRKDDEGIRAVELLSPLAVEREMERLMKSAASLDEDDCLRLSDVFERWLSIRSECYALASESDRKGILADEKSELKDFLKDELAADKLRFIFLRDFLPRIEEEFGDVGKTAAAIFEQV